MEQLPAAVYTDNHDEYSSALYISPQIEAISGFSAKEWLADPKFWLDRIHPDDLEAVHREIKATHESLADFHMDYRIIHRDGRIVWLRDYAKIVLDEEDQPKYWQGILFDITQELEAQRALQAERDFALQVLNHMGQGLTVIGPDSTFEYINPAYASMIGYAVDEFKDKKPADFTAPSSQAILEEERSRRHRGIKSTYAATLAKERSLESEAAKQQDTALRLRERGVDYTLLQEEVNTNRSLYESVLKRLS